MIRMAQHLVDCTVIKYKYMGTEQMLNREGMYTCKQQQQLIGG